MRDGLRDSCCDNDTQMAVENFEKSLRIEALLRNPT
jgi:hypothetical protein